MDERTNTDIQRTTLLKKNKNQITWRSIQLKRSIYQPLAVVLALRDPPARPGNGQPAPPMRLMAHRPNLDPFISCFQNDISLASEDQQAWQEQRSLVSWSQTNTGQENMPRSGTERQTGPPWILLWPQCRHCGLMVRVKGTRGYLWAVLEAACL